MQVKEKLYDRMGVLNSCLKTSPRDKRGYVEEYDRAMANELDFIQDLLDKIERW